MSHEFYMQVALQEAQKAYEQGEVPIGAVVVAENKIIAKAHNQNEKLRDVTAHAEILAITAAAQSLGHKYLRKCRLYVTLEPCIMCAGALFWAQLDSLIFALSDEKGGFHNYQNTKRKDAKILHPKTQVLSGVLQESSQILLNRFFQSLRK